MRISRIKWRRWHTRRYMKVRDEEAFVMIYTPTKEYLNDRATGRYAKQAVESGLYDGRYLDDPEYSLYTFHESELVKPKMTFGLAYLILKYLISEFKERYF